ncbi:hypothetical protein BST96_14990 [Oceanicoccus sagamiensis]|uniref:3-oxoacyl-ACP reductase n=1 Tax=Oceanicoccus sagamiensis TaxID=716816 RepID=A0A1X9NHH5_9GAMM|nr:hypothetical protein BST96_14990 [Oceanicoccus sagamiensis]
MTICYNQQVAIVTGGATGLGRAHAMALAARGARVVVNDLYGAEQVVADIQALGGTAMADHANVSQPGQVTAMVERALAQWDRIDILVNTTAQSRGQSFSKMSLEDFSLVIDANLMGP